MALTLAQDLNSRVRANAVKFAVVGLLLVVAYIPVFLWLHGKYAEPDSYYSHGYLIPFVSAYVVWHKRRRLGDLAVASSTAGLWLLAGGLTSSGEVLFLYWFISGERSMASYYKSVAYRVWDAIWRRPSSGSMVRVALPLVNGDMERTMATAEEFIADLRPLLPRYLVEGRRPELPAGMK